MVLMEGPEGKQHPAVHPCSAHLALATISVGLTIWVWCRFAVLGAGCHWCNLSRFFVQRQDRLPLVLLDELKTVFRMYF